MGAVEISVQVEEIEILVKANIKDALAGMTKLRSEVKKVLSAQLPNLQSQIAPVKQILDQYGNVIVSSTAKAQTATRNAGETIKKTASAAKQAADTEKAALDAVAKEHERINRLVVEQYHAEQKARAAEAAQARTTLPVSVPIHTNEFSSKPVDNTPAVDPSKLTIWQKFTARYYAALDNVKAALNKVGLYGKENIGKVKKYTDSATKATKKYLKQVKTTTSKSGSLFGNLGSIIKRALISVAVYQGVRKLFSTIREGIQNAINAPEIENLFRVAFGKAADQAANFAEKLRSSLGVDVYAAKQMLGTFQEIETSMGIGQQTATKMSESLTMLANDMASLYNVDPEQASENLQSALTGQWRAVRKYGYTLSEATIQQTAYNHGLAQAGAELTEQQKVIARYLTLVDQSKNAHGDMARTLGSVANQLRVLKQNFTAAGRSIGSAFIPFIQAAVPWLNAFMVVLQRVGVTLSKWTYSLFGLDYDAEMKKQQQDITTGLNGVTDAENAAGDAAEKAGKKADKSALGFDRLNKLQSPNSESPSGSGAGSSAGGIDFDVPTLDVSQGKNPAELLADRMQAAFAKIRKAAEPTIEAFHRFTKSLEPIKNFAAKAFEDFYNDFLVPLASWTLGKGLPNLFDILTKFNEDINWSKINKGLDSLWKAFEPLTEQIGDGLNWFLDNVLRPIGEWAANSILPTVLDAIATTIEIIGTVIQDAKPAFMWLWNNFLKPLGEWTGGVVGNALKTIADVLHILEDILKGDFSKAAEDGKKALDDLWQTIGAIFDQNGSSIQFQALGDNVSESTKRAIGAFDALFQSADKDLDQLEWSGDTITKSMADKITKNINGMADQTIAGFERQRDDSIKNIQDLASISGGLTRQEADDIIKNINDAYDGRIKSEQDGQEKIKNILNTASNEHRGLTKDESDQINKIKSRMYDDGVKALSKNQVEEQAIYDNMRVNHTATSAKEAADVVKNSKDTTDKVIADADRRYNDTVAAIVRERDETHTISSDQADKLIAAAKKTHDDTVSSAEDQHQKVVAAAKKQSGEHVAEVDWETGQVKSKWQAMWDNVHDTALSKWNDIKNFFQKDLPKWWNENVAPWFTAKKWQGEFEHVQQAAKDKWQEIKTWWNNTAIVKWWNDDVVPWFTAKKWADMMSGIKEGFQDAWDSLSSIKIKMPHITWTGGGPEAPDWAKSVLGTLNLPTSLPKLNVEWYASGGVFDQKSVIGVGEYANASSNPEIVSPQNVMYETAYKANIEANGELVSALSGFAAQIVRAIRDYSGGDAYLDGEKITENMVSRVNSQIKLTKKSPFIPV